MPRPVTLANLRERVLQRADLTNATQFVSEAEVNGYINSSIDRLNNHVVAAGEDDFTTSTTQTTVAGTPSVSLSGETGFFKLRHVELYTGGGWQPLDRWSFANRARYEGNSNGVPRAYRLLERETVSLYPTPGAAYDVRIWYVSAPAQLALDTDEYDGRLGWDEWVVIDAAIKCVLKEEGDASALAIERAQLLSEIVGHFRSLDEGKPDTVQDVTRDCDYWLN